MECTFLACQYFLISNDKKGDKNWQRDNIWLAPPK